MTQTARPGGLPSSEAPLRSGIARDQEDYRRHLSELNTRLLPYPDLNIEDRQRFIYGTYIAALDPDYISVAYDRYNQFLIESPNRGLEEVPRELTQNYHRVRMLARSIHMDPNPRSPLPQFLLSITSVRYRRHDPPRVMPTNTSEQRRIINQKSRRLYIRVGITDLFNRSWLTRIDPRSSSRPQYGFEPHTFIAQYYAHMRNEPAADPTY